MLDKSLFRLQLNGLSFTPKLIPTLVTVILLTLLVYLGFWQVHRAEYKQVLLDRYLLRAKAAPLELTAINSSDPQEKIQYSPIALKGQYDNQHSLLLDNKMYHHQVGYQVLTPFFPQGAKQIILINRGWVWQGADRRILPTITAIQNEQTVHGIISFPPHNSFLLNNVIGTEAWPRVVQIIDISQVANWLGKPVSPWVVLLAPDVPNGFIREWNPVTISPYKNWGYAVQWFGLAITLFIIFIVVNVKRER